MFLIDFLILFKHLKYLSNILFLILHEIFLTITVDFLIKRSNFQKETPKKKLMTENIRILIHQNVIDKMRIQNEMTRQFLAEFIGTAFLLVSKNEQ